MELKDRISKVQPIWKRLGFSSEEEMTKREALYYKRAAKNNCWHEMGGVQA